MTKSQNHNEDDSIEFDEQEEIVSEEDSDYGALVKKLRKELKHCEAQSQEYLAGWQRAKADYINLKNSEEKSRQEIVKFAKESLLHDLVGLADNFEMAFANKESWMAVSENWRRGIEYIYSNLLSIFETNGLSEVNPIGQEFNPSEHHSIGTIETKDSKEDNKVVEVLKKGYILNGKLIRPAHVKVATLIKN